MGGIGLNPGAGTGVRKLADGADDALGDAEEHGIAGIADGQDILTLAHRGSIGESKMRKLGLCSGGIDLHEGDVEIRIDVNDFGFELLARGENGMERFLLPGNVGVGDDDAGSGDEKARAGFFQASQVNDSGFRLADKIFQRKFRLKGNVASGDSDVDIACKSVGKSLELDIEVVGFE